MNTDQQLRARIAELEAENHRLRLQLAHGGQARTALARLSRLCELLRRPGGVNCRMAAEELQCSRKTIERDLAFLREMGWSIIWNDHTWRYEVRRAPADPFTPPSLLLVERDALKRSLAAA